MIPGCAHLAIIRRVVRLLPVRWRVRLAVVVGRVFGARL